MSDFLTHAKRLAGLGFYIFPCGSNSKISSLPEFTEIATRDEKKLERFWVDPVLEITQPYNIGISTTRFFNGKKVVGLLVVDVDTKDGKKGFETINRLELSGREFPETFTQTTPSGGLHMVYEVAEPIGQSVELEGKQSGLDTRSRGGLIVGSGSEIDGVAYTDNGKKVIEAPSWLIEYCKNAPSQKVKKETKAPEKEVNQDKAKKRAAEFLKNNAPLAIQGQGGDQTTFSVAAKLKDFGLTKQNALDVLLDNWNDRCEPPWDAEELSRKIENAFAYSQNTAGTHSPEADFSGIELPPAPESDEEKEDDDIEDISPIERLNQSFAFCVLGGKSAILRKKGVEGDVDYMTPQAFHDLLLPDTMQIAGKVKQISDIWMRHKARQSYNGVSLYPETECPKEIYNLWRGFSTKPLEKGEENTLPIEAHESFAMFKEHALENICSKDEKLFNWLMGYFAHLIQKPFEKPLTALVLRGEKGTGKNALVDRVGNLIKGHYLVTENRRYLIGNFNKHFAKLLLFVLDEAIWSGDKSSEGILKGLITGNEHLIEHKGRDVFTVKNLTRVCLLSNEEWVVPTSGDERRFGIFDVGNGRQQHNDFFKQMREGIDVNGGNRLLLTYLKEFDLSKVNVNSAPQTQGLLEQKLESMSPVVSYWFDCLREGKILHSEFENDELLWPAEVTTKGLFEGFIIYAKTRQISGWREGVRGFIKRLVKPMGGLEYAVRRNNQARAYKLPPLQESRQRFEKYMRQRIKWDEDLTGPQSNVIDATELFR